MQCDVLVVGAGPAGLGAALAAARQGADTLLVERFGAAGGAFSMGLALTPVGYEPFKYWTEDTDPNGWAVQGLARGLYDRMATADAVVKPVWDIETYKWVCDRMLADAGVRVLFHTRFVGARTDGDRIVGARLWGPGGGLEVRARMVIDCSGDGEVLADAGCSFDVGREQDGRPQPMMLGSIFAGVRLPYTDAMSYGEMMALSARVAHPKIIRARAAGEIPPVFTGLMFPRVVRGGLLRDQVWVRLVQSWEDPSDPVAASRAEIDCRDALWRFHGWLRENIEGFEHSCILETSARVWPRESRRLRGVRRLVEADVRNDRRDEEGVAHGTCFIEAHSATPDDASQEKGLDWDDPDSLIYHDVDYDIPFGCLVPERVDGLLVAGRHLSADHLAQASARMQATSMALGEAAGTAAGICIEEGAEPREIDVQDLRQRLTEAGARV